MSSKYGSDTDVQAAFSKFDVNNDGVLDRDEMEAVQREIENQAIKQRQGADQRHGVSSEVLEAQVERIETFVVAVHGSCNGLHEALAQARSKSSLNTHALVLMCDIFCCFPEYGLYQRDCEGDSSSKRQHAAAAGTRGKAGLGGV
jgi:hypothetical protein